MDSMPTPPPRVLCVAASHLAERDCACAGFDTGPRSLLDSSAAVISHSYIISISSEDIADYDCACSETDVDLISSDARGRDWMRSSSDHLSRPNAYVVAFSPFSPGNVVVLNSSAKRLLESFSRPSALAEASLLAPDIVPSEALRVAHQLAALGLLQPLAITGCAPTLSRTLSIWLHVTDACSLRCSYCYVTKSEARMDETTGRAAIDGVFRSALRNGYRAVKLKYAGGEPTLHFDLVRSLHIHAVALAKESGLALQEVILSNGVALTSDMLDFLKTAGIRLMLSLDGLGTDHDDQRPFENGAPSSSYVQRTIDRAIVHGLRPHISVSVRPGNVASLAETMRFVLDRDLLFNLNFVREALPVSAGWEADFIAGIKAALMIIETRLPQRRLIDGLLDRCNFAGVHDYPCGAGRDYVAVTPSGAVARCHMTLLQPVGDVWAEDPLEAIRATTGDAEFQVLPVNAKTDCRDCTWRSVCAGGCPLLTARTMGRSDVSSPFCKVYQAILPELVRLEGLRILKWQVND